jgi:hypothetical protein
LIHDHQVCIESRLRAAFSIPATGSVSVDHADQATYTLALFNILRAAVTPQLNTTINALLFYRNLRLADSFKRH